MEQSGIIDADVHPYLRNGIPSLYPYLSEAWRERLIGQETKEAAGPRRGDTERPPYRYSNPASGIIRGVFRGDSAPPAGGPPGTDPNFVASQLLDQCGVEVAILIPIQSVNAWTDPLLAHALVAAMNDYFVQEWLPVDRRFRLAIGVLPQDPAKSAAEIRRHAGDPNVVGAFLPLLNVLMGNGYYNPIYEAAEEVGMPIIIHPTGAEGTYLGAPVLAGGIPSTYAERHIGLSQIAQANINSLVFEGTFERYPKLKVVVEEFGFTWIVPLAWRMDMDWRRTRVEVPWVKRAPSEYLWEHVRFTTQPLEEPEDEQHMLAMLEMMHADQTLLFSSDYPHWDNDNPTYILPGASEQLHQRVFRENALETFTKIKV